MTEEIKILYAKIHKKTDFIIEAANDKQIDKSPLTLRNHWFGNFWQIPQEYQDRVKHLLQKKIEQQKATA